MTKPTTRLLLVNDKWVCMVSAMIVEFGGLGAFRTPCWQIFKCAAHEWFCRALCVPVTRVKTGSRLA